MAKNTKAKAFYELVHDENGRLTNILVPGAAGGELIPVGRNNDIENAKSALRAAGDFFKFGVYANPLSDPELHLYRQKNGVDLDLRTIHYGTNLGVISTQYAGNLPIPVPHPSEYPEGWAQINKHGPEYFLTHFTQEFRAIRCEKHRWIRDMFLGFGLDIWVLPFNVNKGQKGLGYADTLVNTWAAPLEEAIALRNAGFDKAEMNRYMNRLVVQTRNQSPTGVIAADSRVVDTTTGEINASVMLLQKDGTYVDLNSLPKPCLITVDDGKKAKRNIKWTGRFEDRLRLMQVAAGAARGWTVEIPDGWHA